MNDLDARIRAAVTELADAAPPPKPLPAMSAEDDRSHRWMAIAAASVLIIGGIVAIATWQSTRDDGVPVDTVATTTPGVTLPPPPTTDAVAPVTTAPSPDAAERTIPVGQITARPDDVLAVDAAGALVLIGIDGDVVAPPVTLVAAPADPTSQDLRVAGLVDGTVLYSVTEGSTRAVMALTAPGADPIELANTSAGPWLSPDGEQWAIVDATSAELVIQRTDGSPGATVESAGGLGSVTWSPDGTAMYVDESDAPLSWLRRYDVAAGYVMTREIERFRQGTLMAGFDDAGNLVAGGFDQENESTLVTTFDAGSLETVSGVWDRSISPAVLQLALSPDGSRLMTVAITGGATIVDRDGATVSIDGVSAAWFASAATTGAPTPTPEPDLGVVVDGPVIAPSGAGDASWAGVVSGVLAYDGTCLTLTEPGGGPWPLVWPVGSTWDPAQPAVVLPDGRRVEMGDRVDAGGGMVEAAALGAPFQDALRSCTDAIGPVVGVISSVETISPGLFTVTTGDSPPLTSGELDVGPDDVVATRPDGTLWWYPGLLGDSPGEPVRLVEMGDPSVVVEEGPGPNVVDAVAGVIEGTLVFGECCEPVAGAVSALTAPGVQREGVGFGSYPVLHPTLPRLATVSPYGLTVTDLAASTATTASFDTGADLTVTRTQVAWAGNSGESLIVLAWNDDGWRLEAFRPDDLSRQILVRPLGLASPVSSTDPVNVSIAGIDPGWNLILAITDQSGTRLQAIDPDDLTPSEPNSWTMPLPDGASAVHLSADGRLIWVEGDTLMTATPATDPRAVAAGVVEGWFAARVTPLPD